jgi:hypothetical protein
VTSRSTPAGSVVSADWAILGAASVHFVTRQRLACLLVDEVDLTAFGALNGFVGVGITKRLVATKLDLLAGITASEQGRFHDGKLYVEGERRFDLSQDFDSGVSKPATASGSNG